MSPDDAVVVPEKKSLVQELCSYEAVRRPPAKSLVFISMVVWLPLILSGCQTAGYYHQAISGEMQILRNRQPMADLVKDPQTPLALKEKFQRVFEIRDFAEKELKLPANGHYLRYVDVHRRYVVWNVHAAPDLSLKPKTWWYPVVGSLKYRGYFAEEAARDYAAGLRQKGLDVYVEGVEAYSTLGWFRDPVLSTFIHHEKAGLAEILFHELAHQRVFVSGDTDFNEAFATAVGEEGVRRWLRALDDGAAYESYHAALARNDQFVHLVLAARVELETLYGEKPSSETRHTTEVDEQTRADKRQRKAETIERLRSSYARLKTEWGGHGGYDEWFAESLDNAQLNTVATYYEWVPAFHRLLEQGGGNLETFYQEVRKLTRLTKKERQRQLTNLLAAPLKPSINADTEAKSNRTPDRAQKN